MSAAEASGPGRRLTPEQEQQAARMYAEGASERDVADELGCSASTAHRLRERLQAAQDGTEGTGTQSDADALEAARPELLEAEAAAFRAELLDALTARRDEVTKVLADWQGRAASCRARIDRLDAERLELLAAGKDAAHLREPRADAEAELNDAITAAGLIGTQLAEAEMRIAAIRTEEQQAQAEAVREQARAEGAELAPACREQLRGAVLGEVAPAGFVRGAASLAALERASGCSWDAEILPPPLPGNARDPWLWGVLRLWSAAKAGDVTAVHQALATLGGNWVERDRDEFARMHAEAAERVRQTQFGPRLEPAGALPPDWVPHTVGLDEHGRPLPPDEPGQLRAPFVPMKPRPDLGYWPR